MTAPHRPPSTPKTTAKRDFVLTLRVDADRDEAGQMRDLRNLLKRLGRNFHMTCIGIRPSDTTEAEV